MHERDGSDQLITGHIQRHCSCGADFMGDGETSQVDRDNHIAEENEREAQAEEAAEMAAGEPEIHGADCDGFCGEPGGCFGPDVTECEWFLDCHEPSTSVVEHPTCGDVEICQRHVLWLLEDLRPDGSPNPTKMVPPIAAKHGAKVRATLARLES